MKNIFESSEAFAAHAAIGAAYWMLSEIQKEVCAPDTRHAIERMIDKQTGYENHKYGIHTDRAIELIERIIEQKKIIEANTDNDVKMLNALKKIRSQFNSQENTNPK